MRLQNNFTLPLLAPSLGKAQQILDFLSDEGLIDRELTEQEHPPGST